jgi:acyl carrier protein
MIESGSADAAAPTATASPSLIDAAVAAVNEVLIAAFPDAEPVTANTELATLPLESVDLSEVVMVLEDRLKATVDLDALPDLRVVGDFANLRFVQAG